MALTREQVQHVALLSRLELSEEELDLYREQLSSILGHIEKLQELDVSGVAPTTHAVEVAGTPLREDETRPSLSPEEALASAPAKDGTSFAVPRIIE